MAAVALSAVGIGLGIRSEPGRVAHSRRFGGGAVALTAAGGGPGVGVVAAAATTPHGGSGVRSTYKEAFRFSSPIIPATTTDPTILKH